MSTVALPPASIVLVLGDLSCLSVALDEVCEGWLRFGHDLRAGGGGGLGVIGSDLE